MGDLQGLARILAAAAAYRSHSAGLHRRWYRFAAPEAPLLEALVLADSEHGMRSSHGGIGDGDGDGAPEDNTWWDWRWSRRPGRRRQHGISCRGAGPWEETVERMGKVYTMRG